MCWKLLLHLLYYLYACSAHLTEGNNIKMVKNIITFLISFQFEYETN